jgi:nitrile hydratase beta subunit
MDGVHDLGGKHGLGAVAIEGDGPAFHDRWQGAVFTIVNGLRVHGINHNVDQFRHAVERIDPVSYLTDGYYGRWLGAAETMLIEAGTLSQAEITARAVSLGADPLDRIAARPSQHPDNFSATPVADDLPTGEREVERPAKFEQGQRVRTQAFGVPGHTRLPAYARGVVGEIVACHGGWVYPDTNAHGYGEQPQHLYTVAFAGDQLWGDAGEPQLEVCIDLFEPYLESVD